ncbi:3-oxoacyl-[acyl-carrier-protein] synthase III C-terminal domain-containing protein [uncultured Hyphomonas sp.]|uniref:hydroxymethylglutaryl-CoA synthase family protein n=1 Tax=uncultured Hyphomonas sp. TaxID=225298 RepID=UPI002AAB098D|nr:3-oxoacyl-[acyl-carrier-protein] synthase III C-terminal domain-containing protein [uncultured Hyphomonas sp.]
MTIGILEYGIYIPRRRLQRSAIHTANAWFAPGMKGLARGEKAVANWDEDPVTMAVEAARSCLGDRERESVDSVVLASTSHPFADRQNAGIVKEALNLGDAVSSMDFGGGLRAGVSALASALLQPSRTTLCMAAERRGTKPGSEAEMTYGDAAAAILVGEGEPVAKLLGHHAVSADFVDHFRAGNADTDYNWESRWVRDEGYLKLGAGALKEALEKTGLEASSVDHLIVPIVTRGVAAQMAKKAGIPEDAVCDVLLSEVGDTGAAHPLLLLAMVLEKAQAGETVVLVGYGQGAEVLVFEVMPAVEAARQGRCGAALARKSPELNYMRHLAFTGSLSYELGMRAEQDQKTALTALYRNRKAVLGLVGGKCTRTGTVQFPRSDISVNQNERAIGTQEDYPLADVPARILTFTADSLTYSPDPPSRYGMVEFEGGGRMMAEFVDADESDIAVGRQMRMAFRIKAIDEQRQFKRYFWKAIPAVSASGMEG